MFFTPNGAIHLVERMRSSDTPDFDHFVGVAIFSKWRSAAIQRQFSFPGYDLQSELRVFSGGELAHDCDLLEALSRWSVTSQSYAGPLLISCHSHTWPDGGENLEITAVYGSSK
jgi:hypothetical protein